MRGADENAGSLFSYVDLESRIPPRHPLRAIKAIVNEALATLAADFAGLYSRIGRPSIPPKQLLRAMLLQVFYAIRSERLLVERLDFDLVRRPRHRRSTLGRLELLEEPRPPARR